MINYTNRFMAALHQRSKIPKDSLRFYFDDIPVSMGRCSLKQSSSGS